MNCITGPAFSTILYIFDQQVTHWIIVYSKVIWNHNNYKHIHVKLESVKIGSSPSLHLAKEIDFTPNIFVRLFLSSNIKFWLKILLWLHFLSFWWLTPLHIMHTYFKIVVGAHFADLAMHFQNPHYMNYRGQTGVSRVYTSATPLCRISYQCHVVYSEDFDETANSYTKDSSLPWLWRKHSPI